LVATSETETRVHAVVVEETNGKMQAMNNDFEGQYPVPGRSKLRNSRIAAHECGHAIACRLQGNHVHALTIARHGKFEGRCMRSGPPTELAFSDDPEAETNQVLSICERLERLSPEPGSSRVADSEAIIRGQSMIVELLAGNMAEQILFPAQRPFGAKHDHTEAAAVARVVIAAPQARQALLQYCGSEARGLIVNNLDVMEFLMVALIEFGTLSGAQIDEIISRTMAMRSSKKERQRRENWRERQRNAAAFLEGI
jgi:hypothetical protein